MLSTNLPRQCGSPSLAVAVSPAPLMDFDKPRPVSNPINPAYAKKFHKALTKFPFAPMSRKSPNGSGEESSNGNGSMVLIEVRDEAGKVTRRCDARCHKAKPLPRGKRSKCVCGGIFRGVELRGMDPLAISPGLLDMVRLNAELRSGESIQLRFGA